MIVVHGLVTPDGRLACWAETTDAPILHPPSARAAEHQPTAAGEPPSGHPFAVLPPLPGDVSTADLLLPSTPARPAASPELTEHLPAARGTRPAATRHQSRWTVPIVVLSPTADAEALLAAAPDTRPGSSIGYLADLAAFATSLVDRGRVVPALPPQPTPVPGPPATPASHAAPGSAPSAPVVGPDPAAATAQWRPVLWGADAATHDTLRRTMPGVFAAATHRPPAEAPEAALDTTVDLLVRARLRHHPLLTDGQVRHDTVVRAWLHALTSHDPRLRTAPAPAEAPALPHRMAPALAEGLAAAGDDAPEQPGPRRLAVTGAARDDEPTPASSALIGEGPEVARLREVLERWADSGRPAPVRTCFRLTYVEDPEDDDFPGSDIAPPTGSDPDREPTAAGTIRGSGDRPRTRAGDPGGDATPSAADLPPTGTNQTPDRDLPTVTGTGRGSGDGTQTANSSDPDTSTDTHTKAGAAASGPSPSAAGSGMAARPADTHRAPSDAATTRTTMSPAAGQA
ncbi:hypothetical protein AB0M46_46250, partial [Dactylosporangium sp. NPDC051485]